MYGTFYTVKAPFKSGEATIGVALREVWGEQVPRFVIDYVDEQPKDKRRKPINHRPDTASQEYHKTKTQGEKEDFKQDYYRSVLGDELYLLALTNAWESCRPTLKDS